jgi:lipoprotein-anchoring transpeptidase ErfK/SrfK
MSGATSRARSPLMVAVLLVLTAAMAGCGGSSSGSGDTGTGSAVAAPDSVVAPDQTAATPASGEGAEAPDVVRPGSVAPAPTVSTAPPLTAVRGETIEMPEGVLPTVPAGYSVYEAGKTVVATALPGESEIAVYETPTATKPLTTLKNPVRGKIPLVFVAEGKTPNRLLVQLPIRPNGSRGWIDITKVSLAAHEYRIDVSLSTFELVARNGDDIILKASVGVGRDNVPSPNGTYYITELLKPPAANSVYGTYAYGLSGFSEVLQEFNGGNGQVGLHGTDDPSSIGGKASSGCIRLNNADIEKLVPIIPLGTPVLISA